MVALDLVLELTLLLVLLVCLVLTVTSVVLTADTGTNTMSPILVVWLTSVVDILLCRTAVTLAVTVLFRERQVVL
jgi:lipopolysaccharide export LptBFGC system permease protein LptF